MCPQNSKAAICAHAEQLLAHGRRAPAAMEGRRWETRSLDALRSAMMLLVFTGHYSMCFYTFKWYAGGQFAVNGFMSISFTTMIVAYHLPVTAVRPEPVRTRKYALFVCKRLARLLPLFYLHKLSGWLLTKWVTCVHDPHWDEHYASEGLDTFNEIAPRLDWASSVIWITPDGSGANTLFTSVHLWFLETMLWLYLVFPFVVEWVGSSSQFRLLPDFVRCVALSLAGIATTVCWLRYAALPALDVPEDHAFFDSFIVFGLRANPLCRVFTMALTIKATLAVTRGQWVPSRVCVLTVLSSLLVLLLFAIKSSFVNYIVPIVNSTLAHRIVPSLASHDDIVTFFNWGHNGADLASMFAWGLAAPIFVHLEKHHREGVNWVLRLPPMRLLVALSRFSLSFYVWQMAAIQLLQLQVTKLTSGTATCYHQVPNMPWYNVPALPDGFKATLYLPAVSQLLLLAIMSHYLVEEPSNALLKGLAVSLLDRGSSTAKRPVMI